MGDRSFLLRLIGVNRVNFKYFKTFAFKYIVCFLFNLILLCINYVNLETSLKGL